MRRSPAWATCIVLVISIMAATPTMGEQTIPQQVVPLPASSSGDYRCFYGPGIQVWQDAYRGGPTMILCANFGRWDNLSDKVENLDGAFVNWNDRISSFEIFNTSVGGPHAWKLCTDANETGSCAGWYTTSVYAATLASIYENKFTSIWDARLT